MAAAAQSAADHSTRIAVRSLAYRLGKGIPGQALSYVRWMAPKLSLHALPASHEVRRLKAILTRTYL